MTLLVETEPSEEGALYNAYAGQRFEHWKILFNLYLSSETPSQRQAEWPRNRSSILGKGKKFVTSRQRPDWLWGSKQLRSIK
jgi:hypothetical protein